MKKLLLSLAAVATVGTALPAAAQTWDHRGPVAERHVPLTGASINQREAMLRARIDQAVARRAISPFQARRLRDDLRRVESLERQYRRHGLTRRELADLDARLDRIQAQLRIIRR